MRTFPGRFLVVGACLGLLALTLVATTPHGANAQPPRNVWLYVGGDRSLENTGPGQWTEFIDGQPARRFDELGRSPAYVELYTGAPQPTWVRIYPRWVYWRTVGDPGWRQGQPGWWSS